MTSGQEGTKNQRALCSQGAPGGRESTKWLGRRHFSRGRHDQETAKYQEKGEHNQDMVTASLESHESLTGR